MIEVYNGDDFARMFPQTKAVNYRSKRVLAQKFGEYGFPKLKTEKIIVFDDLTTKNRYAAKYREDISIGNKLNIVCVIRL